METRSAGREGPRGSATVTARAANLRTKISDFRGFDSSRGEILMPMGNFPEMLSQRIFVGIILVGR